MRRTNLRLNLPVFQKFKNDWKSCADCWESHPYMLLQRTMRVEVHKATSLHLSPSSFTYHPVDYFPSPSQRPSIPVCIAPPSRLFIDSHLPTSISSLPIIPPHPIVVITRPSQCLFLLIPRSLLPLRPFASSSAPLRLESLAADIVLIRPQQSSTIHPHQSFKRLVHPSSRPTSHNITPRC